MIFMIKGNSVTDFVEKLHTLIGQKKVRYVVNCSDYELEFIYNNFKDPDALTVIGLHENYSVRSPEAEEWAKKFEEKFNIPVFMGKVWGLWR
tara:strand:+ start:3991 stop:4266 length:276 start_codon:yes stop_codon:yes gene_type:complete